MKKAFDSYLTGEKDDSQGMKGATPDPSEFDALFGEQEEMEDEGDPLMSALKNAGFEVDESKLAQIRSILEPTGEAEPLAGEETPEEEALEAGMGGGKVPSAMSQKAGRKF